MFTNPQNAMDRWPASLPEFAAFKDGVGAFESLAGRQERTFTLSEQWTVAERVAASVVVAIFSPCGAFRYSRAVV